MKVLIVEDEIELQATLKESLSREHFLVETVSDFRTASEKLALYEYDCILLDIMLPGGSGLDLLEQLKMAGKSDNVIIISAKDSLDDKLRGLESGADDYLAKPFHTAELTARVRAVLRRKNQDGKNTLEVANVILDLKERLFEVDGEVVPLNRKEFDILSYFLFNKNRLVTKSGLAEHVWGDHSDQSDDFSFIYYQIKNLRKKLTLANANIEIDAVYGIGYKLTEK